MFLVYKQRRFVIINTHIELSILEEILRVVMQLSILEQKNPVFPDSMIVHPVYTKKNR